MKISRFILIMFIFCFGTSKAEVITNAVYREDIRTIQAYPEENPLGYPFIALHSGEKLEFHFDILSTELEQYSYGVIHCDHNWNPTDLRSNEYIQGFQVQNIQDYNAGFNTMFEYAHYSFLYPNDMSLPRYSGNYAMIVFDGQNIEDRSTWMISYRFVIYELAVNVNSNVGLTSVVSKRYTAQEVDFDIGHKDFQVNDPMHDINVTVLQNMDWTRAKTELKPIFIKQDVFTFDYATGENVFDGGNEWRNFEVKDVRYISAEVSNIIREGDGYHIHLRPDIPEGKKSYATWADLNGNYLIKNDIASDSDLEADYVWVHFSLMTSERPEAEVYIEGAYNMYNRTKDLCKYNSATGAYECTLLMKQGYYNYRYVIRDKYYAVDDLSATEGNYSNTENNYHIIVYMWDRNLGCDRIISVKADSSR